MERKFSIIRVAILFVIVGAVATFVIARRYGPTEQPGPMPVAPSAVIVQEEQEETEEPEPADCVGRMEMRDETEGYSIDLDFCVTGMGRADDRISAEVTSIKERFLADYAELRTPETEGRFALEMTSQEFTFGRYPYIQSVLLTVYIDTAGAHPGVMYRTWTFDRTTDRMIDFRDMFQVEHNPLWTIHPMVKGQLMQREYADETMIDAAIGNVDFEPYRNFVIDGDELVMMFEPGTVAAYAAGPQEARIPLADIQAILKPPFLDLEELYGEDIPPDAEVMTYEEVVASCEGAGGTWLEEHDECEYVGREWCEDMGAIFRECESACRHDEAAEICTLQCVPVCEL